MFGFRNKLLSVSYIFLFFFHYTSVCFCNTVIPIVMQIKLVVVKYAWIEA